MKKWLSVLLAFVLMLSVTACGYSKQDNPDTVFSVWDEFFEIESTDSDDGNSNDNDSDDGDADDKDSDDDSVGYSPLLYKATDSNGNEVYLLGSIHVGYEDMYPLPQYVLDAYKKSDTLAVECDIIAFEEDANATTAMLSKFMYLDGTTIEDHISTNVYQQAVEILKSNNYYSSVMDYYTAYMWSEFINAFMQSKSQYEAEYGIDRFFINEAYDDKKPIAEVESVEFQYNMFANFSDGLQEMLLQSTIASYYADNYDEQIEEMLDAWCKGDADKIVEMARPDSDNVLLTEDQKKLLKEYDDALIVNRNRTMTDYAEQALRSGDTVFICVGAAHVVGDDGMVQQLKDRGYKVEQIK